MNRLTAWVGDEPFIYGYSQIKRKAEPWIPFLIEIKKKVEEKTNQKFNSCLLNDLIDFGTKRPPSSAKPLRKTSLKVKFFWLFLVLV